MTRPPKISVLIPTFRYARFLPEAIDSVLAQDCSDFELLISDDASDDTSADIIRDYAARDSRIRFQIHERNLGMVANWNWCLAEARGRYVKFVFGDDCLPSPRSLGRMAEMLEGEPRAVLAATARVILDARSQRVEVWDKLGRAGHQRGGDVIGRCLRADRNLIGEPSAVMFPRVAAARGFDATFRQLVDQEMWFHLLSAGDLVYDPEPLCAFRLHSHQQTVVNRAEQVASAETMRIVVRYFDHFLASEGIRPNTFRMRRRLARHIYYSRKDSKRSPLIVAAEAAMMARLGRAWYFICWLTHRAAKPFENLGRTFRKRGAGADAAAEEERRLNAVRRRAAAPPPPAAG